MLQGPKYDALACGFRVSGVFLPDGRNGENFVSLNGSIDSDVSAPPVNSAGFASYLARSFVALYFDLDDLCNCYIELYILDRMLANLIC